MSANKLFVRPYVEAVTRSGVKQGIRCDGLLGGDDRLILSVRDPLFQSIDAEVISLCGEASISPKVEANFLGPKKRETFGGASKSILFCACVSVVEL